MLESDYKFIQKFNRGYRLPYSSYDESYMQPVLQRKKNNAAAIVICLDALKTYIEDEDTATRSESINMLYDEIAAFCVNGLFGIGFFGVSVENGLPIRVDSCGTNVTKRYRSVYRDMGSAEYANLDRIESMILDHQEERKFRQYVLKYKYAIEGTLSNVLNEANYAEECGNQNILDALELDELFCTTCASIGNTDTRNSASMWSANRILDDLNVLFAPYKGLLKRDDVAVINDYTIADLKPVSKTDIRKYQQHGSGDSGEINIPKL